MTISERSSEKHRKFGFLNKFEKEQIQRKILICCKQPFLYKALKLDKYYILAKLCFPVVLNHFRGISPKTSFFGQKKNISERSSEIIRKFVFLYKFEKEQIQRKIRIFCKQFFLFKAVKLDKYKQKLLFSSK